MSLDQLNRMESEALDLGYKSFCHERAAKDLADLRTGPYSLSDAIDKVLGKWHGGSSAVAKAELFAVIDEMASDICRIAEMRLVAKARFYKVEASQKKAIVTASILPIPELENIGEKEL